MFTLNKRLLDNSEISDWKLEISALDISLKNTALSKNLSWSGGLNNYLKLFSSIDWQTSLSYRAPQKTAVSNRKARISSNTALSKDLMKDKLTLTFKINDIFETQKWRIEFH